MITYELLRNAPRSFRLLVTALAPLVAQSTEMGALPMLRAATDPAARGGQYYGPGGRWELKGHPRVVASSPASHDEAVQRRLWQVSETLTGVTFPTP